MKKLLGAALAALVVSAAPAYADHDRDSGVESRQHQLERRVEHGWRSGELTPREYRRLQHELREIARAEHYFRSDGRLSRRERDQLHARLDELSRAVYVQRHDSERRYGSYNYRHHADTRH